MQFINILDLFRSYIFNVVHNVNVSAQKVNKIFVSRSNFLSVFFLIPPFFVCILCDTSIFCLYSLWYLHFLSVFFVIPPFFVCILYDTSICLTKRVDSVKIGVTAMNASLPDKVILINQEMKTQRSEMDKLLKKW